MDDKSVDAHQTFRAEFIRGHPAYRTPQADVVARDGWTEFIQVRTWADQTLVIRIFKSLRSSELLSNRKRSPKREFQTADIDRSLVDI